jgi:hypothetical protein
MTAYALIHTRGSELLHFYLSVPLFHSFKALEELIIPYEIN